MNQLQYSDEIDLTEYYRAIYKNRRVIAIFLVLGIVFGYAINVLPIYNYRAKVLIRVAMVGAGAVESPNQTAEKVKSGFYGKYPLLSADYVSSSSLIQVWVDNKSEEQAKKISHSFIPTLKRLRDK